MQLSLGRLHLEDDVLRLAYRVRSDATEPVYVAARTDFDGGPSPRPHTEVLDDETLLLTFEPAPLPEVSGRAVCVYAPKKPWMARLAPGQVRRDEVRLRRPVLVWHAYLPKEPREPVVLQRVRRLRFRTWAVRQSDAFDVRADPDHPGLFFADGQPIHVLEASLDLPEPLTVRVPQAPATRADGPPPPVDRGRPGRTEIQDAELEGEDTDRTHLDPGAAGITPHLAGPGTVRVASRHPGGPRLELRLSEPHEGLVAIEVGNDGLFPSRPAHLSTTVPKATVDHLLAVLARAAAPVPPRAFPARADLTVGFDVTLAEGRWLNQFDDRDRDRDLGRLLEALGDALDSLLQHAVR